MSSNQNDYRSGVGRLTRSFAGQSGKPTYFIRTFGCQQNVSDSERISGMLQDCGYVKAQDMEQAGLIVFNTCAVREHAEDRVFGNVGELKRLKESNRNLIIALGGCMVQQPHIAQKLRHSYPFVDIIFNTNELYRLPGHLADRLEEGSPIVAIECADYAIREGLPVARDETFRAYVPIMYGCDNFCTYCVVPLVRGRERSRAANDILEEFSGLVAAGYRDIMLLGQNVNSYGKKPGGEMDFARLLELLCQVDGEYTLRFMTSHPRDATPAMLDVIAANSKISRHLHLPVQSGSNAVLAAMNRHYTVNEYLRLVEYARENIEGVTFSSDIIVGFPGETEADFQRTMDLVKRVGYRSLFTFIYSKREGTPAASMADNADHKAKTECMARLLALQDAASRAQDAALLGSVVRVLITGEHPDGSLEARMEDNNVITVTGPGEINSFATCIIESVSKKRLHGKVVQKND